MGHELRQLFRVQLLDHRHRLANLLPFVVIQPLEPRVRRLVRRLPVIDGDRPVLLREVGVRHPHDVLRRHRVVECRVGIDRLPPAPCLTDQQLVHQSEIGPQPAKVRGGVLVLHLLQLTRLDRLGLQPIDLGVERLLDLLRCVTFLGRAT